MNYMEEVGEMKKEDIYLNAIRTIYIDIYKKINEKYINVFLCGGVSTNKKCIRDEVRKKLESKKVRVLYPEDLFMEILTSQKSMNLLSLENLLAENSDIICVLPESPGSLVELGAFTNNKETLNKLFVFIDNTYEKDNSFIIMGPIKYIRSNKTKERVVFYDNKNVNEGTTKLMSNFKKFKRDSKKNEIKITSILGQYYFIQLLFYFVNELTNEKLIQIIEMVYEIDKYDNKDLNIIFYSAIKLLYKNKFITKNIKESSIMLTNKGRSYIAEILFDLKINNRIKLYDYVRYGIMLSEEKVKRTSLENTM